MLADSSIADHADIGPFARMRPGCEIGEDVHIGNFVEVKKSRLHKGVKAGHLAYLGDSEIGARANIGAGVITCTYAGVTKHKTEIGEGAFIGSDSTLVAPVTIGDGRLHRRRIVHHEGCAAGRAGGGESASGDQRRMG